MVFGMKDGGWNTYQDGPSKIFNLFSSAWVEVDFGHEFISSNGHIACFYVKTEVAVKSVILQYILTKIGRYYEVFDRLQNAVRQLSSTLWHLFDAKKRVPVFFHISLPVLIALVRFTSAVEAVSIYCIEPNLLAISSPFKNSVLFSMPSRHSTMFHVTDSRV